MHIRRRVLLGISYFTVLFFLAASLYINLIFGVKFTQKQTQGWVTVTAVTLLVDLLVFSTARIMLLWLVPSNVLRVLMLLLVAVVVVYSLFCSQLAASIGSDGKFLCEISPI